MSPSHEEQKSEIQQSLEQHEQAVKTKDTSSESLATNFKTKVEATHLNINSFIDNQAHSVREEDKNEFQELKDNATSYIKNIVDIATGNVEALNSEQKDVLSKKIKEIHTNAVYDLFSFEKGLQQKINEAKGLWSKDSGIISEKELQSVTSQIKSKEDQLYLKSTGIDGLDKVRDNLMKENPTMTAREALSQALKSSVKAESLNLQQATQIAQKFGIDTELKPILESVDPEKTKSANQKDWEKLFYSKNDSERKGLRGRITNLSKDAIKEVKFSFPLPSNESSLFIEINFNEKGKNKTLSNIQISFKDDKFELKIPGNPVVEMISGTLGGIFQSIQKHIEKNYVPTTGEQSPETQADNASIADRAKRSVKENNSKWTVKFADDKPDDYKLVRLDHVANNTDALKTEKFLKVKEGNDPDKYVYRDDVNDNTVFHELVHPKDKKDKYQKADNRYILKSGTTISKVEANIIAQLEGQINMEETETLPTEVASSDQLTTAETINSYIEKNKNSIGAIPEGFSITSIKWEKNDKTIIAIIILKSNTSDATSEYTTAISTGDKELAVRSALETAKNQIAQKANEEKIAYLGYNPAQLSSDLKAQVIRDSGFKKPSDFSDKELILSELTKFQSEDIHLLHQVENLRLTVQKVESLPAELTNIIYLTAPIATAIPKEYKNLKYIGEPMNKVTELTTDQLKQITFKPFTFLHYLPNLTKIIDPASNKEYAPSEIKIEEGEVIVTKEADKKDKDLGILSAQIDTILGTPYDSKVNQDRQTLTITNSGFDIAIVRPQKDGKIIVKFFEDSNQYSAEKAQNLSELLSKFDQSSQRLAVDALHDTLVKTMKEYRLSRTTNKEGQRILQIEKEIDNKHVMVATITKPNPKDLNKTSVEYYDDKGEAISHKTEYQSFVNNDFIAYLSRKEKEKSA